MPDLPRAPVNLMMPTPQLTLGVVALVAHLGIVGVIGVAITSADRHTLFGEAVASGYALRRGTGRP